MFEVQYTKDDAGWSDGHTVDKQFGIYKDAFDWAMNNVMDGYAWRVKNIDSRVPFHTLKIGEKFVFRGLILIKINDEEGRVNGHPMAIAEHTPVMKVGEE